MISKCSYANLERPSENLPLQKLEVAGPHLKPRGFLVGHRSGRGPGNQSHFVLDKRTDQLGSNPTSGLEQPLATAAPPLGYTTRGLRN